MLAHTWGDQSAWWASTIKKLANRDAESRDVLKDPDI